MCKPVPASCQDQLCSTPHETAMLLVSELCQAVAAAALLAALQGPSIQALCVIAVGSGLVRHGRRGMKTHLQRCPSPRVLGS